MSLFLASLLLLETVPASAITNIGTPTEQATQIPSSIFDGSKPSGGFGPGSPVSPSSGTHAHRNPGAIASGPFGDSFGTDPMLGKPTRRRSTPRFPRNERPADDNKPSPRPNTTTDSNYDTRERGSSEPDHAGAGILAAVTAIVAMIGLATGASWAGILINIALGAVAGVVAVALLFTSPSRGLFSGIIDSFSFGGNPAKALAIDKDNKEEPLNPFYEATYYLAKTALLLASLAFVPLVLTGGISVSLPVLIAGSALSGLNIASTITGLFGKSSDAPNPAPSVIAIPAEGREKQSHKEPPPPPHFSPEQLQTKREQAVADKTSTHIAMESLSPSIKPDDKAKKYPVDDQSYERIKQSTQKSKWSFTIATKENDSTPQTTRGFLAYDGDHDGLDILAPKNSPVINQEEATVLYARYHQNHNQKYQGIGVTQGLGNTVILNPKDTTRLLVYQHFGNKTVKYNKDGTPVREPKTKYIAGKDEPNSGILAQEGETIHPGMPIGLVGNTGSVTQDQDTGDNLEGTHLHVSVVELDPNLNPNMKRLQEMAERGEMVTVLNENNKPEEQNAQKLYQAIWAKFKNIEKAKDRPESTRQFITTPNYKRYIYMNPIEAPWFYKDSNEEKGK